MSIRYLRANWILIQNLGEGGC